MLAKEKIPRGVRRLIFSTSIRYFGWGFGEVFIPVFLLLFSANFFQIGALAAVYNLIFFLSIPLAGFFADNLKSKTMILAGLVIYVFIGASYFTAGLVGMVAFIILARGLNGVSYSFDQVGRESYVMRHSRKSRVSRIFGHFDFITNFWWLVAVLIGFAAVKLANVSINWLLFLVAPTSIISFFVVLGLKEDRKPGRKKFSFRNVYVKFFGDIMRFDPALRLLAFIALVFGIASSAIYFFVPISAYLGGNGIVSASVLALVYTIPILFGDSLGKIADLKKEKIYLFGFISLIILMAGFVFLSDYWEILVLMFLASAVFELVYLARRGTIDRLADRTHLGEVDGSLNGVAAAGAVIGPIAFGFLMDRFGISNAYFSLMGLMAISLVILFAFRKKFDM